MDSNLPDEGERLVALLRELNNNYKKKLFHYSNVTTATEYDEEIARIERETETIDGTQNLPEEDEALDSENEDG